MTVILMNAETVIVRCRTESFHKESHRQEPKRKDFDSLLAGFLKESDERLTSLKRNTEGKRGGRGGRRS